MISCAPRGGPDKAGGWRLLTLATAPCYSRACMRDSNPRPQAAGFSLIELLVVVLIVAVLAAMGIAQYAKTVEVTKSEDALSVTQAVANAQRMYALDHAMVYLDGEVSACTAGGSSNTCSNTATNACDLMYCGYMARQDLTTKPYQYYASNGTTTCGSNGTNLAACSKRRATAPATYSGWGFTISNVGVVATLDTNQPAVH